MVPKEREWTVMYTSKCEASRGGSQLLYEYAEALCSSKSLFPEEREDLESKKGHTDTIM